MTHDVNEPPRLSESTSDTLLRDVLEAGRSELGTSEQLAAVAAKLGPVLGAGGAGGASGAGGMGGASATQGSGVLATTTTKVIALVGASAVVAAGLYVTRTPPPNDRATTSVAAPAIVTMPPSVRVEAAPIASDISSEAVPSSSSSAALAASADVLLPRAPRSARAATTSTPAQEDEVRTLQRAHDALRADPSRALAVCAEHSRFFPDGLLAQEREVIAIDALTRLGKVDEARARARRFRERYPASSHLGRIEVLVGKSF